jgi:hypothetical protein
MLIRASIAAAALTLAAATPSFADGMGREPYVAPAPQYQYQPQYEEHSSRVVFDEKADHCAPRRQVVEEGYVQREEYASRPVVRPVPNYYDRRDRGYDHGGY